ncbi:MAG: CDP-archaeol synthase [Clostridia bacterium]|nr:CDP-archaeol synthase [Clostridia bacterium]
MLKRSITGAVLAAVVVGFFFLRRISVDYFHILLTAFALIGSYEMNSMLGEKTSTLQKAVSLCACFFGCIFFFLFKQTGALISYLVFSIITFFIPVFTKGKCSLESLALSFLSIIYPGVMLIPFMSINYLGNISTFALVLVFVCACSADVFAYLVGRTLKGKKLCPEISPKKTISGAIGGLIGGIVGAVVTYAIMKNTFTYHLSLNAYVYFAVVGLLAAVLTELGDLVESFIKRSLGVKDSGKIFPGHGGMLDRIDGIIFASLFIYMVTALF